MSGWVWRGRLRGLIPVVSVLITVSVCAGPSHASSAGSRTVNFVTHFHDPGSRIARGTRCAPGYVPVGGTAYFAAPLRAVDTYHGCLSYDLRRQTITGQTWDEQVGSLTGCGRGSFVMHQTNFHTNREPIDRSTHAARLTLTWTIVPGSGTGAFAGATGSGTGYTDLHAPTAMSFPGVPNNGVYKGTIRCYG